MVDLGLDWSDARPGGALCAAHGVKAVGRYLADDARGISAAEYADLTAHGIKVWLVYEGATRGMLNGAAQGTADALYTGRKLAALGLPLDSVVYWAADYAIGPNDISLIAATDAYVTAWNKIIPNGRRGGYGGLWYLHHISEDINFRWECASTSFRYGITQAAFPTHLQQTTIKPPIADTDHNYILNENFGAVGSASTTTPTSTSTPTASTLENDMPILVHVAPNMYIQGTARYQFNDADFKPVGVTAAQARDLMIAYLKTPAGGQFQANAVQRDVISQIMAKIYPTPAAPAVNTGAIATAVSTALKPLLTASESTVTLDASDITNIGNAAGAAAVAALKEQLSK